MSCYVLTSICCSAYYYCINLVSLSVFLCCHKRDHTRCGKRHCDVLQFVTYLFMYWTILTRNG